MEQRVRRRSLAASVCAVLLLSSCAPLGTDFVLWSDAPTAEPTPTFTPTPRPEPVAGPRVAFGFSIPRVATPADLVPRVAAMRGDGYAAAAQWSELPESPANAAFVDRARAVIPFVESVGASWSPGVDIVSGGSVAACPEAPSLPTEGLTFRVDCAIVAANGPILAQRFTAMERSNKQALSISRAVIYANTATGEAVDGAGLYTSSGRVDVLRLIREALRDSGRIPAGAAPFAELTDAGQARILADSTVLSDGDIAIETPVAPAPDGSALYTVPVILPGHLVAPFLSGFGADARGAISSQGEFVSTTPRNRVQPVDCGFVACVALTFDDGPDAAETVRLLDELAVHRAAATFYLLGVNVSRLPGIAADTVAAGHEVGNHTWGHPDLTDLPDPEVRSQVDRGAQAIHDATGVWPSTFRPPYGAIDPRVRQFIDVPVILWDVDTLDWERPGVDVVTDRAVNQSAPGDIVLMHDIHAPTVDAVPGILDGLVARGFAFATVGGLNG